MEGNTYPVKWKKQGNKFLVYLGSENSIKGSDIDFETACEELCLSICAKYSDGEAVLNFLREPPKPTGISKYANPALVMLSWNESAEGKFWQAGLFEKGYCKACKAGVGKRTSVPLEVETLPKGEIGSFRQPMFSPVLLSKNFVSLLSDTEKLLLGLQSVICEKEGRREFFEVNGKPILNQVGVKEGEYNQLTSWECESCGHKSFSCNHPEMPDNYKYTDFVCTNDLPDDIEQAFVIEDRIGRKMVCMSLKRWRQINDNKYTNGVSADRLYVLPEKQIDREPKVRIEAQAN